MVETESDLEDEFPVVQKVEFGEAVFCRDGVDYPDECHECTFYPDDCRIARAFQVIEEMLEELDEEDAMKVNTKLEAMQELKEGIVNIASDKHA